MDNISYIRAEFDKRRTYKQASSFCQAYACPIFHNCLLEIKQLREVIDRLIGLNQMINNSDYVYSQDEITSKNLDILKEVSE